MRRARRAARLAVLFAVLLHATTAELPELLATALVCAFVAAWHEPRLSTRTRPLLVFTHRGFARRADRKYDRHSAQSSVHVTNHPPDVAGAQLRCALDEQPHKAVRLLGIAQHQLGEAAPALASMGTKRGGVGVAAVGVTV